MAGAPVAATPRLLEAGLQRERDLLAAVVRNPSLVPELAALTPDHFDDPLHRRFREVLVGGAPEDEELVALRAELGARADRDELDERAGKELLLRLHERRLRRELQGADLVRATELQARLAKVHRARRARLRQRWSPTRGSDESAGRHLATGATRAPGVGLEPTTYRLTAERSAD